MQVLKFGGTSVANAEAITRVVNIVGKALAKDRTIVVCSAIGGCTDTLIGIGRKASSGDESYKADMAALKLRHHDIIDGLFPPGYRQKTVDAVDALFAELEAITSGVFLLRELSPASLQSVESFGELFSTRIVTDKFLSLGTACRWIDSRKVVRTLEDGSVDTAITYAAVASAIEAHLQAELFIVPGFISSDAFGRTTTLGRGGSDYTASLFAVGIHARRVEIWTDVPGIMTANPKVVPTARTIPNISYRAAQELSHFGAKVIYPPTIQPVVAEGIPSIRRQTAPWSRRTLPACVRA